MRTTDSSPPLPVRPLVPRRHQPLLRGHVSEARPGVAGDDAVHASPPRVVALQHRRVELTLAAQSLDLTHQTLAEAPQVSVRLPHRQVALQVGLEQCILGKWVAEQGSLLEERPDGGAGERRVRVRVQLAERLDGHAAVRHTPTEHVQSQAVTTATHPDCHC